MMNFERIINYFEKLYNLIREEKISRETILQDYDQIRVKSINLIFANPRFPSFYQTDIITDSLGQELRVIKIIHWLIGDKMIKGLETEEDRFLFYMDLDMKAKEELKILYEKLKDFY